MNYEKLVQGILNIGEAMLQCGAEIFRVEDSLIVCIRVMVL